MPSCSLWEAAAANAPAAEPMRGRSCLAALVSLMREVAGASCPGLVASANFFREHVVAEAEECHNARLLLAVLSAIASVFRKVAAFHHHE